MVVNQTPGHHQKPCLTPRRRRRQRVVLVWHPLRISKKQAPKKLNQANHVIHSGILAVIAQLRNKQINFRNILARFSQDERHSGGALDKTSTATCYPAPCFPHLLTLTLALRYYITRQSKQILGRADHLVEKVGHVIRRASMQATRKLAQCANSVVLPCTYATQQRPNLRQCLTGLYLGSHGTDAIAPNEDKPNPTSPVLCLKTGSAVVDSHSQYLHSPPPNIARRCVFAAPSPPRAPKYELF